MNLRIVKMILPVIFLCLPVIGLAQAPEPSDPNPEAAVSTASPGTPPLDHSAFTEILKRFVSKKGVVDYRTFKRDKDRMAALNDYLDDLMKIDGTALEKDADRMSYWLNLYNGLVLKEILKRYPVQTVAQIPNFFSEPRYEIAGFPGKKLSLLDIEQVFRDKFNDPRLNLARVNGSMSAPPLMQEAFEADKFDKQIEEETMNFLKDSTKNFYDGHRSIFYASPIFMWSEEDFSKYLVSTRAFLVGRVGLPPKCQIQYMGYDWKLNDTKYR
jgi:hypothetical protein